MILKPYYNKDVIIFAETNFRDQRKKFGIKREDRRRHMYVVGKTGMGKTTMIKHMIVKDMKAGEGICVVDSGGSLVSELLYYVPKERVRDVVFFNPGDIEYPVGFNLLGPVADEAERQWLVEATVSIFRNLWVDVWGARLEYVFTRSIETLLYRSEATVLHIVPLLTDEKFRNEILEKIENPVLLDFWHREFWEFQERFALPAVQPILDKMGRIMTNPLIRNIIGQAKTSFDFTEILEKKKIVFLHLPRSKIGDEASSLLGTAFISKLGIRAKQRYNDPHDFYLYIDELQYFTNIHLRELAGSSSYGLNLVLVNQYISQMPEYMKEAIFGNVGTIVAFRVCADDAAFLAEEFSPHAKEETLLNLPPNTILVKLSIDGQTRDAFTAVTLEPLPIVGLADMVIAYSREVYGCRKEFVEEGIMKELRASPATPFGEVGGVVRKAEEEGSGIAPEQLEAFRQKFDARKAETAAPAWQPSRQKEPEYREVKPKEEVRLP